MGLAWRNPCRTPGVFLFLQDRIQPLNTPGVQGLGIFHLSILSFIKCYFLGPDPGGFGSVVVALSSADGTGTPLFFSFSFPFLLPIFFFLLLHYSQSREFQDINTKNYSITWYFVHLKHPQSWPLHSAHWKKPPWNPLERAGRKHFPVSHSAKREAGEIEGSCNDNTKIILPDVRAITPFSLHPQMCLKRDSWLHNESEGKGCEPRGWCKEKRKKSGEEKRKKKKKERRLLKSFGREGGRLRAGFWKSPISQMSRLLQQGGGESGVCEAIEERNEQHGSKSKGCCKSRLAKKEFSGRL